ncbi:hypothetical protein IDH44_16365 [Paenibacillus sp. IB182496]|uniref:Uncharacterized protein n=1 Tax=Paenibacillus sabuli TaxID=2772509 RepID=A0A927BUV8_9BACL|nr:hypothetical protein [Paenibacillus sabuli]MBD2846772.1 hypothetical protein [Paenibacillus sabuli]
MAFGITREELNQWKSRVMQGELAFLTHYWLDPRFPGTTSVTKVGCADLRKLTSWGASRGLNPEYIHRREGFPHFDLFGHVQLRILHREGLLDHIARFRLEEAAGLAPK